MNDDTILSMLEAVAERLDRLEAQAVLDGEALTRVAEIALLAYAASGAGEPLPEELLAPPAIAQAASRHRERLTTVQPRRDADPLEVRAHLKVIDSYLELSQLSEADKAEVRVQMRTTLNERMAQGKLAMPRIGPDRTETRHGQTQELNAR
jgi:hypothetical protein